MIWPVVGDWAGRVARNREIALKSRGSGALYHTQVHRLVSLSAMRPFQRRSKEAPMDYTYDSVDRDVYAPDSPFRPTWASSTCRSDFISL